MKKILLTLLVLLAISSEALPQIDQAQVANSFKVVVDSLSAFFQMSPKWLFKSKTVSNSSTGIDVRIDEFSLESSSYDVQKTESIISPYVGFVILKLWHRITQNCGNVPVKWTTWKFWDNVTAAVNSANSDSCYGKEMSYNVKFLYSFQENKWIYKNIINADDGKEEFIISKAFRQQGDGNQITTELEELEFNKKWYALADKIREINPKKGKEKVK